MGSAAGEPETMIGGGSGRSAGAAAGAFVTTGAFATSGAFGLGHAAGLRAASCGARRFAVGAQALDRGARQIVGIAAFLRRSRSGFDRTRAGAAAQQP